MDKQYNELMIEQLRMFEKQTEIELKVKDGKPYYNGWLLCVSDELPDNLLVDGDLMCYVESTKLPNGLKVNGLLDISQTDIIEIPDDCEFKSLNLRHAKVTKLRDNLELDELQAYKSSLTALPKGLKVKDDLDISGAKITEIPNDCEFGSLDISYTKITKLRDNLTLDSLWAIESLLTELPKGLKVKDDLDISGAKITEIPNDCEFGCLHMKETKIKKLRDNLVIDCLSAMDSSLTELPKNLVVYGGLYIENTIINHLSDDCLAPSVYCNFEPNDKRYEKGYVGYYKLKDEIVHISHPSGREFLHVDGILSEVIEKKGNVYHVKNGVNEPITYVVTDGNHHWAHGKTLDKAKQDLRYKMSFRDKSEYKDLTLDSELTFDEAVACYRVITGACKFGTNDYLKHRLPEHRKEKYTIKEMIELTKDEYGGNDFCKFFENDNL